MEQTAESINKEIERVNIKLVKLMGNAGFKDSEEYKQLRTRRQQLTVELGRLIRSAEYIAELENRNRGVKR